MAHKRSDDGRVSSIFARIVITFVFGAALSTLISTSSAFAAACSVTTTTSGNYKYVKVTSAAGCTWSIPAGVTSIDYLAVGGGGGGGGGGATTGLGGGGGGAGGVVLTGSVTVAPANTLTITVGTGGAGGAVNTTGTNGSASSITYNATPYSAAGGNAGIRAQVNNNQTDLSGDGGSNSSYNGGQSMWDGAGGGAGAGGIGGDGQDIGGQGGTGGPGGIGLTNATINTFASITSTGQNYSSNYYFGGGGGGGSTPPGNGNPVAGSNTGVGAVGGYGGGGTGGFSTTGVGATSATANTGGGGGGGGWKSDATESAKAGAAGADGIVLFRYLAVAANITSATTFSVAENQFVVGTATADTTVAWSIVAGSDSALFSINSSTGAMTFNAAPDFEAPADIGADNTYNFTIRATTLASVATDQAETVSVTDVVEALAFKSLGISGGGNAVTYRTTINLVAVMAENSRISFIANGKFIPGCRNLLTSGSASTWTAACAWKSSLHGQNIIRASAKGVSGTSTPNTSPGLQLIATPRSNNR